MTVRTRIAPSPTGKMHIGTARTALFNWLFAKRMGGEYCVRIEDTDKERSTAENIDFIKDGLQFLGLEPEGDYVLQSENIQAHKDAAQTLLDAGKAFEDDGAVRFRIPEGITAWEDLVQGKISYKNETLEDFVILRSDGTPTYHLGVVVDDATMNITHVMRGDDHINNTPKQILLHQALGNAVPTFAHLPLIHGADGAKLSKRHGAASVQDYRAQGYLPEGVNHYLMMLSWLAGDDLTPVTLDEAAAKFEVSSISKGAPRFDVQKLAHVNGIYMQHVADIAARTQPFLTRDNPIYLKRMTKALPHMTGRAKTLVELAESAAFFTQDRPLTLAEKEQEILNEGQPLLLQLADVLEQTDWQIEALDNAFKGFVTDAGVKFPALGKPARIALTGGLQGPGLGVILYSFGKEESLKRLRG